MSTTAHLEAAALRRSIYGKGEAGRADLAGLLALAPEAGDDPEFLALVADVARDVLVTASGGFVSEAEGDWLTAHLGDGGGLSCRAEFEVLKSVLTHAVSAPSSLAAFAVREVERAILTGRRGPLGGGEREPGIVAAEDVEALRAVAFAPTEGAATRLDRAAAEALFDIAHATATARNDPAFAEFFAQAVGDYVLGAVAPAAGSREPGPVPERAEDSGRRPSFGAFVTGLSAVRAADGRHSADHFAEERYFEESAETEARLAAASEIDAGEARWILVHLTRGGELSQAEKRLIAFLRDAAGAAPGEIAALFDRAA